MDRLQAAELLWRRGRSLFTLVALTVAFAATLWFYRRQDSAMEPPPPAAVTIRSVAAELIAALPGAGHPLGAANMSGHVAADTFWVSGPVLDSADGTSLGEYEARLLRDGVGWILVGLDISYLSN